MDVLTALSTISKSGIALLATLESSMDPSRVAVFETYRAAIVLNERVGRIEGVLLDVHEGISELPGTLREALDDARARTATEDLRAAMEGQVRAYERFVENAASGTMTISAAHAQYAEDLDRRFDRLEEAVDIATATAPLALDEVLYGIAIQAYFLRREGNTDAAVQATVNRLLDAVNRRIIEDLNPMIEDAHRQLSDARKQLWVVPW